MLKNFIAVIILTQLFFFECEFSYAQEAETTEQLKIDEGSWLASPNNWINSKYNTQNTSLNFANSVKNFANREDSPSRINILNTLGFVVGFAVQKPDGGVNYFDEDGERIGYSPDGGISQFEVDGDSTTFTTRIGPEK